MPPETEPTKSEIPTAEPVKLESKTVEQHILNAAKTLEYSDEPQKPAENPEDEALAELEGTPKPKVEKKTQKAAKPEPEPTPEPEKEPKLSKRELFMQKADKEKAYREKEAKLKEREAEVQSMKAQYEEMMLDPFAFLEKRDPTFFEKAVDRYTANGEVKNKSENPELLAKIEKLEELITGTQKTQKQKEQEAYYHQQLNEGLQILTSDEFADVHKVAAEYERFNGRPTDLKQLLENTWLEFYQTYKKPLTPRETCEILLEDAQADLERWSANQAEPPAETTPKKAAPPPTGNTITQQQETLSEPAPPKKYDYSKGRDAFIQQIANGELRYKEEE
jgi:hypothetical protein